MPKTAIDYSKCMFYRLVCRDPTVKEVYVGHTTDESNRRRKHKSDCTNEKGKSFNLRVYRVIRNHGGFDNWELLVHEKLPVEDKIAARLRERHWCEHFSATLNSNVPGRTDTEYRADHREEAAAYYADHREEAAAYYAEHVDEIKITQSAYHAKHREKRNQQTAAWNAAHADHLKAKHDCPCGGKYTTAGKSRHVKTSLHLAYLATL